MHNSLLTKHTRRFNNVRKKKRLTFPLYVLFHQEKKSKAVLGGPREQLRILQLSATGSGNTLQVVQTAAIYIYTIYT